MPIPSFTASGVLPPFIGDTPIDPAQMSPYAVSFSELANRFGFAPPRWVLLQGLASYRAALLAIGTTAGFQWIDGSFLEDAESLRGRPPADIDVVTFGLLPSNLPRQELLDRNTELFVPQQNKARFGCDAYFVDLGIGAHRPDLLVMQARYWYGLFSHQRASSLWKGMLQIDLLSDDHAVMGNQIARGGGHATQA